MQQTHPWNDTAFFFFAIPLTGLVTPPGVSGTSWERLSTPAWGSPASWISLDCQIVFTTTLAMACGWPGCQGLPSPRLSTYSDHCPSRSPVPTSLTHKGPNHWAPVRWGGVGSTGVGNVTYHLPPGGSVNSSLSGLLVLP